MTLKRFKSGALRRRLAQRCELGSASLASGRFVIIGEGPDRTVWPGLTERLGDITRVVFADSPVSALTTSDLLYLAQVVEAYEALTNMDPKRRDRICTAIRKAARLREKTR